jgi:hypothetical protein
MSRSALSKALHSQVDHLLVDEEYGDLDAPPHLRMLLFRDGESLADELESDDLEDEDLDFLSEQAGCIILQKSDGTFHVRYFLDEDELEDRWQDAINDAEGEAAAAEDDESAEEEDE